MNYYREGKENIYIVIDILRNKVTSFNSVLNFRSIIARIDQCFGDKRSLQVPDNAVSILRQGKITISHFYDAVDLKLTLNVKKKKVSYPHNENARESTRQYITSFYFRSKEVTEGHIILSLQTYR